MSSERTTNGRAIAITVIAKWLRTRHFPDSLLPTSHDRERALAMEITYGVIRNLSALDFVISEFCRKSPQPLPRAALLVGAWQLLFNDAIPAHAATSETVEAVKSPTAAQPGFINSVLRNITRKRDTLTDKLSRLEPHIRLSHPKPLYERLVENFGVNGAISLMEADNLKASVMAAPLPFNSLSAAQKIAERFKAADLDGELLQGVPTEDSALIYVPHGIAIEELPGYKDGDFIIQDPATLLSVSMLNPQPGEIILDCCAAPGGKTMQLASMMKERKADINAPCVIALDSAKERLLRLKENLKRTGLDRAVKTALCDAASERLFDEIRKISPSGISAVLADVPCSNSGVLRRRPDARWRWSLEESQRLAVLQGKILGNVARLQAERIVYSTCSIDSIEDEDVVREFLASDIGQGYYLVREAKLLPTEYHDGAYAALLMRREGR